MRVDQKVASQIQYYNSQNAFFTAQGQERWDMNFKLEMDVCMHVWDTVYLGSVYLCVCQVQIRRDG